MSLLTPALLLIVALVLNACANIIFKIGAISTKTATPHSILEYLEAYKFLIIGIIIFAFNCIFYFLSLRSLPISVAYPVMVAGGFLIVISYAFLFLEERITNIQLAGYVCIVLGIILVVSFMHKV